MEKYIQLGKEFGLEGTELLALIKEQQEQDRENRCLEREQKKQELELERQLLREKEEMERNLQRENEKIEEAR